MQLSKDAMLLRIFVGEQEKCGHQPLYGAIVMKAREMHLAGATALRGPLGYGRTSRLRAAKMLRLSTDLSVVVEIVDTEDRIDAFLVALDGMIGNGLVTTERVQVRRYGRPDGQSES